MSSTSKVFRDASEIVRTKWLKRDFMDEQGRQCLLQSVMTSADIGFTGSVQLPNDYIMIIDERLQQYAEYRLMRASALSKLGYAGIEQAIMLWNDVPWRRRGAVVKVLGSIADSLAEQEIARLSSEIVTLKVEVERLKGRITELENVNATLRQRIGNFIRIERDKSELQKLSDDLDAKWQEFSAVSTQKAGVL